MIVGLDGLQSIGYWFTSHENATSLSNLVKSSLDLTHEHGIQVMGIVFDGATTNIRMCNKLGANLSINNLKNWFDHPVTKENVFIFLDACHMLKLMRNLIGETQEIFMDGYEHPAKMEHFRA